MVTDCIQDDHRNTVLSGDISVRDVDSGANAKMRDITLDCSPKVVLYDSYYIASIISYRSECTGDSFLFVFSM